LIEPVEFQLHCRATHFIFFAHKQDDKENWLENFQLSIKGEHPQELRLKSILSLEEDSSVSESLPIVEKKQKRNSHKHSKSFNLRFLITQGSSSKSSLEGSKVSKPKMLSSSSNSKHERRRSQPRRPPPPLVEETEKKKEPLAVVEEKEPSKPTTAPICRQRSSSFGDASPSMGRMLLFLTN
jgi:hypothetical protein